jgi:hypothetical protein
MTTKLADELELVLSKHDSFFTADAILPLTHELRKMAEALRKG